MIICGIDPGGSGGVAIIDTSTGIAQAFKMPETERDVYDLLSSKNIELAYMEAVHAFPGSGVPCALCHQRRSQGVSSTFTFGQNYGFLRGMLVALKIPFTDVSPMKWKKVLGLKFTAEDSKTDKKNGSKQLAQQWFPQLKITHAISEALLIAEYARRCQNESEKHES